MDVPATAHPESSRKDARGCADKCPSLTPLSLGIVSRRSSQIRPCSMLRQGDNVGVLPRFSGNQSHERSETFMSVEENVALMRRWFKEVWNEGKTQTVYELLSPDAIGIGQLEDGDQLRGPAEFLPLVERIRGAFPDINMVVEDAFGAEDKVVLR